ncbi:MAG: glycosyltransferase [Syntrophaceae bacterium]|nr:glycosyltransferase [Syntrophaceae bacterium]
MPGPLIVLIRLLDELNKRGQAYAIIHGAGKKPPGVESDVDIALGRNPLRSIEPVIRYAHEEGIVELIQRLHYEIPFGYYYILKVRDGSRNQFLHLDCLYDPIGLNRYRLKTPRFLSDSIRENWGYRASDVATASYLIAKRAVKEDLSSDQWRELLNSFEAVERNSLLDEVKSQLGSKAAKHVAQVTMCRTPGEASSALKGVKAVMTRGFRLKHPFRWGLGVTLDTMRKLTRFFRPTGTFVVVVGPDGSGKSGLAEACCRELRRGFRRVWRFHWRPGLLPKLRKGGGEPVWNAPPKTATYSGTISLARYLYYLIDFLLGYWFVIYPKKARTTLIIGERWYYDIIANPERYGFRLPQWLIRLGGCLVPSPDLTVLLAAQPEVIHARKPELTPDEIREQTSRLRNVIEGTPQHVEISTDGTFENSLSLLTSEILDKTSMRALSRTGWKHQDRWSPFPGIGYPKVWIHCGDNITQALRLYNPYSLLGRSTKKAACWLPRALFGSGFFLCPEPLAEDLRAMTRVIRLTLCEDRLTVSFSTGTPGPDRKITAQASLDDVTQAYVKIASSGAARKLLENESRILRRLSEGSCPWWLNVPRVIAEVSEFGQHFLFLSAPLTTGSRSPMHLDELDWRFLNHMLPSQLKRRNVDAVILESPTVPSTLEATANQRERQIWLDAVEFVRDVFGEEGVPVGPCHGDYAPWNTMRLPHGKLFLFDWEYGSDEAALLSDIFHRIFMPGMLVKRECPARLLKRLFGLVSEYIMMPSINRFDLGSVEMYGLLMCYLLNLSHRKREDVTFLKYMVKCAREVLLLSGWKGYRRKVLVSAYACEPDQGSEPGVGWHWVDAISTKNEAWVLTRINNRPSIERELSCRPNPNLHFEYVDLPRWLSFWKKGQRGVRTYYYLWQFAALIRSKRLMREVRFDLAHHVTFVNDWLWTFLSLTGIPFVWGPIGSNPRIFEDLLPHARARRTDKLRMAIQRTVRLIDPFYWFSAMRTSAILLSNRQCGRSLALSLFGRGKVWYETAIGIEPGDIKGWRHAQTGSFRVLFVGRFVPIKGAHLAIEAFARFLETRKDAAFTIVGSGPEERDLFRRIRAHGIENRVTIKRWMPREEVLAEYRNADVFLFPSMEGAGMVVLEALGAGLPVVCLDFGGPGSMINSQCGYKVPISHASHVISRLADGLGWISELHNRGTPLGDGAVARAREFVWSKKVKFIQHLYDRILQDGI